MAQAATEFNNIAAFYLQIAFRNSAGYPVGQTISGTMSNGATSSAYLVDGLIDLTPGVATNPRVTNQGGQKVISQTPLPANDYGSPTFQLSQRDEQLEAYLSDSLLDVSYNSEWMMRGANVTQEDFPNLMAILSVQGTDSTTMAQWWDNYLFYNCRIVKSGEAGAGQVTGDMVNPNPFQYTIHPAVASRHTTGALFSGMTLGLRNNQDAYGHVRADNPIGSTTFIGNGAATTFILGYRPVDDDATGSKQNNLTIDGTQAATTSISITTGVVTAAGSPTAWVAEEKVVVLYETNFVAI